MHSFYLPHGEMTITLQDMEVIIEVPIDGLSLMGYTEMLNWGELCGNLLGHRLPDRELGGNKNTTVMERARVKDKWLEDRFSNPLPINAPKELVQQYARFYILEMLGGTLFMDKSSKWISIMYLQFSIQSATERIIVGVVQH